MFEDGERLEVVERVGGSLVVAVHGRSGVDHLPFGEAARSLVSVPVDAPAHPSVLVLAEAVRTARELADGESVDPERRRRLDRALRDEAATRLDEVVGAVALDDARPRCEAIERDRARLVVEVVPPDDAMPTWRARLGLAPPGQDGPVHAAHALPVTGSLGAARLGGRPAVDLRRGLRTLAEIWSAAAGRWPRSGRRLDEDDVRDLLGPLGARLALAGIGVAWVAGRPGEASAERVVDVVSSDPTRPLRGLAAVALPVDIHLRLDDEILEVGDAAGGLRCVGGRWVVCAGPPPGPATARLADLVAGRAQADGDLARALDRLRAGGTVAQDQPDRLRAELRPYQRRGLHWLSTITELGLGGCLADDMGLGKTVQVIALHLHRRARCHADGPTLVVCPTSLLDVWIDELRRFAPGVVVHRHHGPSRALGTIGVDDVVVTSYGVTRRDVTELGARSWDLVVADEAQVLANPTSDTARAVRRLRAGSRLALTGTPVQNRLGDLWAIFDWCLPGLLGSSAEFDRRHTRPIVSGARRRSSDELDAVLAPFLLRRTKTDPTIVPDLPRRTVVDHEVALGDEQRRLYAAAVDELLGHVRRSSGIERRGRVLRLLTTLKQICNHPAQHLGDGDSRPDRSGKLGRLDALLDDLLEACEPVVVVSQYVEMLGLLDAHLATRGVAAQLLTGRLAPRARHRIVDRFQRGEVPVLLLSLRAGGTGLTLTRAAHLVHYDRWWNPAVEDQASDRIWRIGQTRPVTVHRLVTLGTVEERIAAVLAGKRRIADAVLGADGAGLGDLDDTELGDLVRLAT
ncbi:MAG: DEAD/DEAH box helicase [Actinomycetota bacterium]